MEQLINPTYNNLNMSSYDDKLTYNPYVGFQEDGTPINVFDLIRKASCYADFHIKLFSYTGYDYNLNQFVRHVYAIRDEYKERLCRVKEVRRDFEDGRTIYRNLVYQNFGCARGTRVIWKKMKSYYYGCIEPTDDWFTEDEYYYSRCAYNAFEVNTPENVILTDDSLKYFGYQTNQEVSMFEYIKQYRKYPIVETFMKLGLYRLILNQKAIDYVTSHKGFRKWLCANAEDCKGRAFTTILNSYKKNPNAKVSDYYNSLQYRIDLGKKVAMLNRELGNKVTEYTTLERIDKYCTDNDVELPIYFDYLRACDWLQLNFEDTKVLFPKDFKKYHDDYCNQYAEHLKELEDLKESESRSRFEATVLEFKDFEYKGDKYSIILAKSKGELISEGSFLNHCVGKMGYDKKVINRECLICFLRLNECLDTPYVTIQLNLDPFRALQAYGRSNSRPEEEVNDFIFNEWLPICIKRYKKNHKEEKPND